MATEQSWLGLEDTEGYELEPLRERAEGVPKITPGEVAQLPVNSAGWLVAEAFPGGYPMVYASENFETHWSATGAMQALLSGEEKGPVHGHAHLEGPPVETEDGVTIESAYGDPQAPQMQGQEGPQTTGSRVTTRMVRYPDLPHFWERLLAEFVPALLRIGHGTNTNNDLLMLRIWGAACVGWLAETPVTESGPQEPVDEVYAPSYYAAQAVVSATSAIIGDDVQARADGTAGWTADRAADALYVIMFDRDPYGTADLTGVVLRLLIQSVIYAIRSTMYPSYASPSEALGTFVCAVCGRPMDIIARARHHLDQDGEVDKALDRHHAPVPYRQQPVSETPAVKRWWGWFRGRFPVADVLTAKIQFPQETTRGARWNTAVAGPRPVPARTHPWTVFLAVRAGGPMVVDPGGYDDQWKRFKTRATAERWMRARLLAEDNAPDTQWKFAGIVGPAMHPVEWFWMSPFVRKVSPIRVRAGSVGGVDYATACRLWGSWR